ncbi:MAG: prolyl oligopeptidase family serine peptidase [Phycisphaerae bacterium]|nr:prolyl oligopeptidase family serine peptidase [Phycisphaerae bacterium]
MTTSKWGAWFPVAVLAILATQANAAEPALRPGQHPQSFEKQVTVKLDYLLYLPADYHKDPNQKWPLILFLHGIGERGADPNKVAATGLPQVLKDKKDFRFVVVSPQCPSDTWWRSFDLNALLDDVLVRYRVDPDRVYLTGLSMGGYGSWDLAGTSPQRFAAAAPMCGGGNPASARRMRGLPFWVFHGDADPVVPVKQSDDMVEALKQAGAEVKYTRYPGVGHDCWTQSYNNPELYTWFLSHTRGQAGSGPGQPPSPGR